MSASSVQVAADVPHLHDSGYKGNPYHHVDFQLAPLMFIWWAKTPTGRQSKYWKTWQFNRLRSAGTLTKHQGYLVPVYVPDTHYRRTTREIYDWLRQRGPINCCPKLPKGYEWQGPFLYHETIAPTAEGGWGPAMFMFRAPAQSAGTPIRYVAKLVEAAPA